LMEVENIILNEVSKAQKTKNCMWDFRSRANTARGLDFVHMISWEHTGRYEDR
jgi:hypothetical protein